MPIRAAVTLVATAVGVILLFSFRTPPPSSLGTAVVPPRSSATPTPTAGATPSGAPPSGGGSPTPSPTARPTGLKNGAFNGQAFSNNYGLVQIQLVVSGGRITDVKPLQYPADNPQSAYINSQALPLLKQEVLQAQSDQINVISGATFTSDAYYESLQTALAQANG